MQATPDFALKYLRKCVVHNLLECVCVYIYIYIYRHIAHDNICKIDHAMPTITRRTKLRYSSLDTVPEIPQLNSTAWLH